jgi:hypothetical protein
MLNPLKRPKKYDNIDNLQSFICNTKKIYLYIKKIHEFNEMSSIKKLFKYVKKTKSK